MIQYSNDEYVIMGMCLIIYALLIFMVFLIFNKCYRNARTIDKLLLNFIIILLIAILCSFIYNKKKDFTNETIKNINNNFNNYYNYIFDYFYIKIGNYNNIEKDNNNSTFNKNIPNGKNNLNITYNKTLDEKNNDDDNNTDKENYIHNISDILNFFSLFIIKLGNFINNLFDKIFVNLFNNNNKTN